MKFYKKIWDHAVLKFGFLGYFAFLREVKLEFFIAVLAGVFYGIASGFGIPVILKFSSERIFSSDALPTYTLILVSISPIVAISLRSVFSIINAYYIGFCGQTILQGLRVMIFDKIQRLPLEYFKKNEPGVLITRCINDTAALQENIISISQEIIKQPIAVLGSTCALIFLCHRQSNATMLLIFLLASAVVVFPIRAIGKKMREKTLAVQSSAEGIATKLSYNLSAVQEIRAFAMEEREVARYKVMCQRVMDSVMNSIKCSVIMSPAIEMIAAIGVSFAMFYAYKKQIGPSVFIALSGALYLSYEPIKKIGELFNRVKAGSASLSRIEELLNFPEKIHDPENPIAIGRLAGNISFDNVSFSYDREGSALNNICIDMPSGKAYALVGASGAGKTTMANLILRFYDVCEGGIKIDGIDIRSMRLKDLRGNISFVPQSPSLINGTITENIKWSAPNATFEAVVEAAQKAYAHDFILKMENGYDTRVGEGGGRLSGGEKQRIAIARAFLRDAPILILDEATSSLDANSEHEIHIGIGNLIKNRTSILISHRFTMMSLVDKVFVLDRGKIVEVGSPDDLIKQKTSIYHSLYQKQREIRTKDLESEPNVDFSDIKK
jgi:subfamily B ATP-binding cassette protein MsbA